MTETNTYKIPTYKTSNRFFKAFDSCLKRDLLRIWKSSGWVAFGETKSLTGNIVFNRITEVL